MTLALFLETPEALLRSPAPTTTALVPGSYPSPVLSKQMRCPSLPSTALLTGFWWGKGRWGCSGYATPKHGTLVGWIFSAEGIWELFDLPLKKVIRPSCERCPPWRKGTSLLQTWSSPEKSPNKQVFLVSPNCRKNFLCLPRTPQPNVFLHSSPPFIKLSIKTLGFNCLLGSSFPCEGSYVM